jgi:hypothetical protein
MFSTQECLEFGPRHAVDQELHKQVRSARILRLAWGVFVKPTQNSGMPDASKIAAFKAQAFQRTAWRSPEEAQRLLLSQSTDSLSVATNGSSSSLIIGDQRVRLTNVCPRKLALGDSKAGLLIRTLWALGPDGVTDDLIRDATVTFGRTDFAEIRNSCSMMPAWLADKLVWRFKRNRKTRTDRRNASTPDGQLSLNFGDWTKPSEW